jgi:hypothetical protein
MLGRKAKGKNQRAKAQHFILFIQAGADGTEIYK